jgi:hypothetical protein
MSLEEVQTVFTDGFGIRKAARLYAIRRSMVERKHDAPIRGASIESRRDVGLSRAGSIDKV